MRACIQHRLARQIVVCQPLPSTACSQGVNKTLFLTCTPRHPCISHQQALDPQQQYIQCTRTGFTVAYGTQASMQGVGNTLHCLLARRMYCQKFASQHGVSLAHDSTGRADVCLRLQLACEPCSSTVARGHRTLGAQTCNRQTKRVNKHRSCH